MGRILLIGFGTIAALAAWAALVIAATLFGWGRATLAPRGDAGSFAEAAIVQLDTHERGNAAFTLMEDGRVVAEHFTSAGEPVDRDTLFQVASLSKWITAWGVMTLVDAGRIDLDAPVSSYLTRWRLPESEFNNDAVTVRRLLSHTAGLTDGLGYGGFAPGAEPQTLEQSLTRASDASPGADGVTRVGQEPEEAWLYSGGGYTLLQLIIEEVSGESFNGYMQRAVLAPLGMSRSTFEIGPETDNVAQFFDEDGSEATHYRFTAQAAASLYTTSADLARFVQAHLPGPNGEPAGRGILRPQTLDEMRRPHASQFGAEIWGLGVVLYAPNNRDGFIIGHDGSNAPAINTAARFDPATGDGIIVLETGDTLLATRLAGDWVFWNTGQVDLLDVMASFERTLLVLGVGALIIVAIAIFLALRGRRRVATSA